MDFEEQDVTNAAAAQRRTGLSTVSELENCRSPLDQLFCAERAKLLIGCYRRNDANDPDTYIQAITMVLTEYPRAVVEYVTDPRGGIQSQEQFRSFPPNSGEVKAACEAEMRRIILMQQPLPLPRPRAEEYVPKPKFPGCFANIRIIPTHPKYAAILEWTKSPAADPYCWKIENGSLFVSWRIFDDFMVGQKTESTWKSPSNDELRASLARLAGRKPTQEIDAS